MLAIALATVALPSPFNPLSPTPPLGSQPPLDNEGVIHRVETDEHVRVRVDPRGRPFDVRARQRLVVLDKGDYVFVVPAPVVDVLPAPGSESSPGQRRTSILWSGFNPRRKVLAADARLRAREAAPALPIRVETRGDTITVENATAVDAATFTAGAAARPLARYLDLVRTAVSRERLVPIGTADISTAAEAGDAEHRGAAARPRHGRRPPRRHRARRRASASPDCPARERQGRSRSRPGPADRTADAAGRRPVVGSRRNGRAAAARARAGGAAPDRAHAAVRRVPRGARPAGNGADDVRVPERGSRAPPRRQHRLSRPARTTASGTACSSRPSRWSRPAAPSPSGPGPSAAIARRIAATGAGRPVQSSKLRAPWRTSASGPSTTTQPAARAAATSAVSLPSGA